MKLLGGTPLYNEIEMLAMLTSEATLRISVGGQTYERIGKPGLNVFAVKAAYGRPLFEILRRGTVTQSVMSNCEITERPRREDPVYVGGSSTRQFLVVR
jgi:hypothetical protein